MASFVPASSSFEEKLKQHYCSWSCIIYEMRYESLVHQFDVGKFWKYTRARKKTTDSCPKSRLVPRITSQHPHVDDSCQNSSKFGSYRAYRRRQGRDIGSSYPASNCVEQPEGTGWCRILKSTNNAFPRKIFDEQTVATALVPKCDSTPTLPFKIATEIIIFN